jgi:hypothetical protein
VREGEGGLGGGFGHLVLLASCCCVVLLFWLGVEDRECRAAQLCGLSVSTVDFSRFLNLLLLLVENVSMW